MTDPKQEITEWLVNKQLSDGAAKQRGLSPKTSRLAPHAAAHGFAFDSSPLAYQYHRPAQVAPGHTMPQARFAFDPKPLDQGGSRPIAGGRLSSGSDVWPAPSEVTTRYVGQPNYWATGIVPPADTGTRWGNSMHNHLFSALNRFSNRFFLLGDAIEPYSDYLDAAATFGFLHPDPRAKLAGLLLKGLSSWSKYSDRTVDSIHDRITTPPRKLPNRYMVPKVPLHVPREGGS